MINFIKRSTWWQNTLIISGNITMICVFEALADYLHYMYWMYKNNHLNFFWYSLSSNLFATLFFCAIIWFFVYIIMLFGIKKELSL